MPSLGSTSTRCVEEEKERLLRHLTAHIQGRAAPCSLSLRVCARSEAAEAPHHSLCTPQQFNKTSWLSEKYSGCVWTVHFQEGEWRQREPRPAAPSLALEGTVLPGQNMGFFYQRNLLCLWLWFVGWRKCRVFSPVFIAQSYFPKCRPLFPSSGLMEKTCCCLFGPASVMRQRWCTPSNFCNSCWCSRLTWFRWRICFWISASTILPDIKKVGGDLKTG